MKIAHISESISSNSGGLQFAVSGFARALESRGNVTKLFAGIDSGQLALENSQIDTMLLPHWGTQRGGFLGGLRRELDRFSPALVIQHGVWSPFVIQLTRYCKSRAIPLAIVTHGMLDPYILNRRPALKSLALALYQHQNLRTAKLIRALNAAEADHIRRVLPDAALSITPNGIDMESRNHRGECLRDDEAVLFLGRLDDKKGVLELLQTWQRMEATGLLPTNASLTIAGWGSDEAYIEQVKHHCQVLRNVSFRGPIFGVEKFRAFAEHGAFILPSKGEGLPTTVLEAWNAGCCVLMSKECNFSEEQLRFAAVDCGKTEQAIQAGLCRYFSLDSFGLSSLRARGLEECKKYSWSVTADKFIADICANAKL